ncbi:MAG: transporter substrate-binding domain-containing protein [Clostridia bacterium]|nr:transporter substrate-binding domain-containing protein [Clostridia bacterium]
MKKFIATSLAAIAACATVGFASCGQKDTLIVYTEAGFPPWEFTRPGSTAVVGVDMEIAKYIADKYDWELQIINGSFDTIVAGIEEDNALGIAGISYSEERAADVEFSDFYWGDAYQAVVYSTDSNPTLTEGKFAASNFDGAKLVYQTGTTSQITVSDNQADWGVASTGSFSQVMAALEEMTTATNKTYLIVDSQVAAQLVAENTGISYAAIEGVEAEQYGVVAKKGNTALIEKVNAALEELLEKDANGKNQIEKWFVEYSADAE